MKYYEVITRATFGVEKKVLKTCTDNGANMAKAFKEGEKLKSDITLQSSSTVMNNVMMKMK